MSLLEMITGKSLSRTLLFIESAVLFIAIPIPLAFFLGKMGYTGTFGRFLPMLFIIWWISFYFPIFRARLGKNSNNRCK